MRSVKRKLLSVLAVLVFMMSSYCSIAYAADMPITFIQFPGSLYDPAYTGSCDYYYYISGPFTYTAPPGSKISFVSYAGIAYSYSNSYTFQVDSTVYQSDTNNNRSSCHWLGGVTVSGLSGTTAYFSGGRVYFKGGLVIGLTSDIADGATLNATKTSADNAYTAASTAATQATNAANNTTYSGQSAAYWANQASSNASTAATQATNAANNTLYNSQSAAYWAYLAANNTATDTTPPIIQKLSGLNGATCTTSSAFTIVVSASDNKSGQLQAQAKVDSGAWSGWVNVPGNIPVTLPTSGAHTITVQVKDAAGNISTANMVAFRI